MLIQLITTTIVLKTFVFGFTGALVQQLLSRIWDGEEDALAELLLTQYERLSSKLKMQIPKEMARTISEEDVLQDVFISVFRSFRSLNPCSEDAFIAWLDTVAKNQLIDTIRKVRTKKRGGDKVQIDTIPRPSTGSIVQLVTLLFGQEQSPSLIVAKDEAATALVEAIEDLPAEQCQAVKLRYLTGMNLSDVAASMDRSEDSVRNLIFRAKDALRQKLRMSELWLDKK